MCLVAAKDFLRAKSGEKNYMTVRWAKMINDNLPLLIFLFHLKYQNYDPQVQEQSLMIFIPAAPCAMSRDQQSVIEVLFTSAVCVVEPASANTQHLSGTSTAALSAAEGTLITACKGCINCINNFPLHLHRRQAGKWYIDEIFRSIQHPRLKWKIKLHILETIRILGESADSFLFITLSSDLI